MFAELYLSEVRFRAARTIDVFLIAWRISRVDLCQCHLHRRELRLKRRLLLRQQRVLRGNLGSKVDIVVLRLSLLCAEDAADTGQLGEIVVERLHHSQIGDVIGNAVGAGATWQWIPSSKAQSGNESTVDTASSNGARDRAQRSATSGRKD